MLVVHDGEVGRIASGGREHDLGLRIGDIEGADEYLVLRLVEIVDDGVDACSLGAGPAGPEGDDGTTVVGEVLGDARAGAEQEEGGEQECSFFEHREHGGAGCVGAEEQWNWFVGRVSRGTAGPWGIATKVAPTCRVVASHLIESGWDFSSCVMMENGDCAALRLRGVSKRYGGLKALDEVDLEVKAGEIFALLGPNGAGKTTAIGCASGLIQDFEGEIEIGGYDVRRDYRVTRRLVGLVPQELNFDGFFCARDALFFQSGYYGLKPDRDKIESMLRKFSLYEKADTNTRRLSGGMKRRLMVCKALMHDPAVLFLDEPTAGVDVELREDLWEVVRGLRDEGVTIVLTTHYLEEAEQLADRIGIIDGGKVLRVQPREELMSELGKRWVEVRFATEFSIDAFSGLGSGQIKKVGDFVLRIEYDPGERVSQEEHVVGTILDLARSRGLVVTDVQAGRSSLEDIFKDLLKDKGGVL